MAFHSTYYFRTHMLCSDFAFFPCEQEGHADGRGGGAAASDRGFGRGWGVRRSNSNRLPIIIRKG
jgi:hypothetical protein